MTGPTHELLGGCAAFGVSRALALGPLESGALIVTAFAASRMPDQLEGGILAHRGITHTIPAVIAVFAASFWIGVFVATIIGEALGDRPVAVLIGDYYLLAAVLLASGVAIGYVAHLLADMCTRSGLKVGGRRVHLLPQPLRVRTGSTGEQAVQVLAVLAVALYAYLAWWPR